MTDKLRPLQNRAIQGRYSPGSTFKIAVAVAALEEGVATPAFRVFCPGGGTFYGRYYKCHLKGGHGSVDMRQAIEGSCNVYFYTLGNMLGVDRMHKWASALGLGVMSGIDLPHETLGLMPSTAWKKTTREPKWYPGETISVAIGQGQVSVTPISLAVMAMTVANGGTRFTPHLVRAAYEEGKGWQTIPPPPPQSLVKMKQSTIEAVHDGMWMVVNAAGTGRRGRLEGRDVAGKTGTAQVISIEGKARAGKTDKDLRDHGWFIFYAPAKNPAGRGHDLRGARRARLSRRADREAHDQHLLPEEGRQAHARVSDESVRRGAGDGDCRGAGSSARRGSGRRAPGRWSRLGCVA